jgi:peptide/nickel transport system substrate-binding protein
MQKLVYDSAAYIITVYYNDPQAYRSDRFTGLLPQPDPDGSLLFQYGTYSYKNMRPVTAKDTQDGNAGTGDSTDAAASDDSGSNTGLIVGGIVVAVLLIGGIAFYLSRRRPDSDVE